MSDSISMFQNAFGKGEIYRSYSDEDHQRLHQKLPPVMIDILKADGWCSYKKQVFWLCDPDDWSQLTSLWPQVNQDAWIFARSAFGDLFLWDGEWILLLMVHDGVILELIDDFNWFFSNTVTHPEFATQTHLPERIGRACQQAGRLNWDEMYTYVPTLSLGGNEETSVIERVKILEGLSILSQLDEFEWI